LRPYRGAPGKATLGVVSEKNLFTDILAEKFYGKGKTAQSSSSAAGGKQLAVALATTDATKEGVVLHNQTRYFWEFREEWDRRGQKVSIVR